MPYCPIHRLTHNIKCTIHRLKHYLTPDSTAAYYALSIIIQRAPKLLLLLYCLSLRYHWFCFKNPLIIPIPVCYCLREMYDAAIREHTSSTPNKKGNWWHRVRIYNTQCGKSIKCIFLWKPIEDKYEKREWRKTKKLGRYVNQMQAMQYVAIPIKKLHLTKWLPCSHFLEISLFQTLSLSKSMSFA